MLWAKSDDLVNVSLKHVVDKSLELGVIHWAGCLRTPYVGKMLRGDILNFFERYYYSSVKKENISRIARKFTSVVKYHGKQFYYLVKPRIITRIVKVIHRERAKSPGKSGFSLLKNRFFEIVTAKFDQ